MAICVFQNSHNHTLKRYILSYAKVTLINLTLEKSKSHGVWEAQSMEHPTRDFGSGHNPRVVGLSARWNSVLSVDPA